MSTAFSDGNNTTTESNDSSGCLKTGGSATLRISTSFGATTLLGIMELLLYFSFGCLITVTFTGRFS